MLSLSPFRIFTRTVSNSSAFIKFQNFVLFSVRQPWINWGLFWLLVTKNILRHALNNDKSDSERRFFTLDTTTGDSVVYQIMHCNQLQYLMTAADFNCISFSYNEINDSARFKAYSRCVAHAEKEKHNKENKRIGASLMLNLKKKQNWLLRKKNFEVESMIIAKSSRGAP